MNLKDKIKINFDISIINEYGKNIEKYLNIISNVLLMKISIFNIKSYYKYLYYDYNNKLEDIYKNIKNNYFYNNYHNIFIFNKKKIYFLLII